MTSTTTDNVVAAKLEANVQRSGMTLKPSVIVISLGIVFSCSSLSTPIECITLSPIYWNISNPIFKSSKNDHIISVNPFDEIDFVCPFFSVQQQATDGTNNSDSANTEFYLIYQVSKNEYDECSIFSENSARLILSCTQPKQRRRFTIWFDPFQSVPKVPEYKAGNSYYFITPSTGEQIGLDNLYQGACFHHNMKLTIRIRDFIQNEISLAGRSEDGAAGRPNDVTNTTTTSSSSRDVISDSGDNRPRVQDVVSHYPRRHQQQQQHPAVYQNNRSSSSSSASVYSRRNLSRHLSVTSSSSRKTPSQRPPPTSAASDNLQDEAPAHQTDLQVKGTEHQEPNQHLSVPQQKIDKSIFSPKQEGLAVTSTAPVISTNLIHGGFQLPFPFGHYYLCCVTAALVLVLIS